MKIKNYEKMDLVTFSIIVIFVIEVFCLLYISFYKEYKYHILSGIVVKENLVLIVVSKEERKLLYNNSSIFFRNKNKKYIIIEDRGEVMFRNNRKYYEMLIDFKFNKKYKTNDILKLVIKKQKFRLIEMFNVIWEGG